MAVALTRLGVRTAWACDFGTDLFSRLALEAAESDGIDPVAFRHLERSVQMVSAAFADRRERGFITYREARCPSARDAPPGRAPAALAAPELPLHAGMARLHAGGAQARYPHLRRLRGRSGDARHAGRSGIHRALRRVFGERSRSPDPHRAPRASTLLSKCSPTSALPIVIKRGAAWRDRHDRAARSTRKPAPRVTVVDTVGAGDAFAAGFIAGALRGLAGRRAAADGDRLRLAVDHRARAMQRCPTADQLASFPRPDHTPSPRRGPDLNT